MEIKLTPWEALQFDQAVVTFGIVIENALAETVNGGSEQQPRHEPKYDLAQLLDPAFRLPRPPTREDKERVAVSGLVMAAKAGMGGLRYKFVPAKRNQDQD